MEPHIELYTDGAASGNPGPGGFGAKIEFTETEALVSVDLSFLLKPLKGKILETIEKQIKKIV